MEKANEKLEDQKKELIGESKHIKELRQQIKQAASSNLSVLIQGPTGTGKELVAREIHSESLRRNKPFKPVVCIALSENLLESELFGHVKGSFTGAICEKKGLLDEGDGGTIFLDEIGDINIGIQAKLLRVLQEKEFTPVGATKSKKVDIRLIAATNSNLSERIIKQTFREDFYYRLSQFNIHIKPLSERIEDIVVLINYFAAQRGLKIDPKTKFLLYAYDFPGNVRDLENLIGHDYSYLKGELLRVWVSRFNEKLEINGFKFQINNKEILGLQSIKKSDVVKKIHDPILKQYLKDNSDDAKSDYFKKLQPFNELFSQLEAFLYPESYPEECGKIVEAYEIIILRSNTDLSNDQIAKQLHIRPEKLSSNGFKKYFDIEIPEKKCSLFNENPLRIYPTFTAYWNEATGKHHFPYFIK